jgi:dihydroorotate dehydrogenase
VINVSSPNTPGLRALQTENELTNLLSSIRKVSEKISCENQRDQTRKTPLILLKVAPDLNENEIKSISSIIRQPATRIDGLIISNTTIERMDTLKNEHRNETGGLSGRPLKEKALQTLRLFRHYTQGLFLCDSIILKVKFPHSGQIPLIGVGGIETAEDILERMRAGASLVQSKFQSHIE